MSMLDSSVAKKDHSRAMRCRSASPSSGCCARKACTALPKPYQPGSITRHCDQLNTQGIARRSSIAVLFLREAGRLPMLSAAISLITVDSQK